MNIPEKIKSLQESAKACRTRYDETQNIRMLDIAIEYEREIKELKQEEKEKMSALQKAPKPKAETSKDLAAKIAAFINQHGLNNPYGGTISEEKPAGKKPYLSVAFSSARSLDGEVRIYNRHFLIIGYQTRYQSLPHRGWHVINSGDAVLKFLEEAFVKYDGDAALLTAKKASI